MTALRGSVSIAAVSAILLLNIEGAWAQDSAVGSSGAGEAYVVYGGANVTGPIDLTGLNAAQGFIIQGDEVNDRTGRSVSAKSGSGSSGSNKLSVTDGEVSDMNMTEVMDLVELVDSQIGETQLIDAFAPLDM